MGLIFKGNPPSFSGNIKAEVPTPTYSGKKSINASDSINPYTSIGPGIGGAGLTETGINNERAGISGHPYQSIINTYASVVVVDITGNDTTGDGSAITPVATIKGALDLLPTGGAVVFNPGTHVMNDGPNSGDDGRALFDRNQPIGFFGTPNQTIIQSKNSFSRDAHVYSCNNSGTKSYGMIFHNEVAARATDYSIALISRNSVKTGGSIYNCAFTSHNDLHSVVNASLYYNNSGTNDINIFNCSFMAASWLPSYTSNAPYGTIMQDISASGASFNTSEGIQINTVTNVSFDANWHITAGGSDATNGVYSGINAWV